MDKHKSSSGNRQPFTTSQLIRRQIQQLALLVVLILTAVAILAWSTNRNINRSVQEVLNVSLEERIGQISDILFDEDPYLVPDTAYLIKLWDLFYNGTLTENNADLVKMQQDILINIRKGIQYNASGLRSSCLMLEDEAAPYVVYNGQVIAKDALLDNAWMDTCRRIRQDVWVEWRVIPYSYLHSAEVVSVYRKITSTHWSTGEQVSGYWVMNLDASGLNSTVSTLIDNTECVYLYNDSIRDGYFISEGDTWPESALASMVRAGMGANGYWQSDAQGQLTGPDGVPLYYMVSQPYGDFLITVAKADYQLRPMISSVYQMLMGILLVCCVIIVGLCIVNVRHLRNYNQSLYKVLMATEAEHEPGLADLIPRKDLSQVVDRLMNNAIDLSELEAALQSEKELKTELQLLYGHTQINSHFLLNTLDSIYWASVRNNGADSDESVMIEDLCHILKFALDSSSLYTSLREEARVTRIYLEIMGMRRQMPLNVTWNIPEELMDAKVSKLIIQPIVENCVQHASSKEAPLNIRIAAWERRGVLTLSISDNGVGMKPADMRRLNDELKKNRSVHGRHIGMANVNRRIQVQYGPNYGITLSRSEEGGLCVQMRMAYTRFFEMIL
ncbi:MAG: sensor histidine kinase [Aristaeellaceae bacterium]